VIQDPELKEDGKKAMLNFDYVPAEECLRVLGIIFGQPEEIVKEFGST